MKMEMREEVDALCHLHIEKIPNESFQRNKTAVEISRLPSPLIASPM